MDNVTKRRIQLQKKLEEVLGSPNVYYQPPSTHKMTYPAIVYGLDDIDNRFANDKVYTSNRKYLITVIDPNPDSLITTAVSIMDTIRYVRHYESDNLNHDVFALFY